MFFKTNSGRVKFRPKSGISFTKKFHEKVSRLEENTPKSTFARFKRDAKQVEETVNHREKFIRAITLPFWLGMKHFENCVIFFCSDCQVVGKDADR